MAALEELGVLAALGLRFDAALAEEAEALLPADGARDVLLIALALAAAEERALERLALTSELAARVRFRGDPSERELGAAELYAALDPYPVEAAAIAAALAARRSPADAALVRDWLQTQRHVRLEIDGRDLLAAGIPEGPEVGARLAAALAAKRSGGASGREQELRAALDHELPVDA